MRYPPQRKLLAILLALAGGAAVAATATGLAGSASGTHEETRAMSEAASKTREGLETAAFSGGCFWGVEEIIREVPGVVDTEVGYTGGTTEAPTYDDVKTGRTGHAEAVQVVFDPRRLSYEDLLGVFFRLHDPTTVDRQGNDVGRQYRSAIFYQDETQRQVAEAVRARVDASGKWKAPVVTEIVPAGPFHPAESYHQDYLQKNPRGYTCHWLRD